MARKCFVVTVFREGIQGCAVTLSTPGHTRQDSHPVSHIHPRASFVQSSLFCTIAEGEELFS